MRLPVSFNNRFQLGKFVKANLDHLAKAETRLVNETMREVACHTDNEDVRQVIAKFFQ